MVPSVLDRYLRQVLPLIRAIDLGIEIRYSACHLRSHWIKPLFREAWIDREYGN